MSRLCFFCLERLLSPLRELFGPTNEAARMITVNKRLSYQKSLHQQMENDVLTRYIDTCMRTYRQKGATQSLWRDSHALLITVPRQKMSVSELKKNNVHEHTSRAHIATASTSSFGGIGSAG